ncbi:MAG: Nucleotidyltransferase domain protein [Euryarchaeota archaeon ADurb.Bin009]|jgi:predicted nucleotidyltransferase|uniref:nucleotidyltransferase domain-containing protein n=1 Tax=Methanoculleus sp. TaxID=90427 RepID=UPI0009C78B2F|nr:nucleotidyltransferase domain-containing protein [Methanoculleus sp.]OQC71486.1 MAG: Nucleotidyltransferase domain protein [Euryarchaeota archaeon ADurb.Bin009]MBP7145305.1 nucleotidyltransferase domain-containing protein [Methanoculleus sp.]HNQ33178.1 nucleotidyltransferase domain-containing protein [Methanoculleus sp.]HNT07386.1 nucleotidyltransferase domain-containing protein [Methanoculleus sp.]HOC83104.1 nucleotidyltransferase domain-containing protein [Methanoculleus sp.]
MLEALIPSKARVKLLTLFLLNPESEFYIREIVRMTGENINGVRRELANLESFGLLIGRRRGNQHYFTVNRDFFLYTDLQQLVLKTEGVARVIRENLSSLQNIECMFIYGSFARGTAGGRSDIDLFIVGDVNEEVLIPLVHTGERAINREINYTLMRGSEFAQRRETGDPFVKNVMGERKIMIIGSCDDRGS